MSSPETQVSSHYGAPMGRRSCPIANLDTARPISLRRVRLDSGGYDQGGAYWGIGLPLFYYADHGGDGGYMRARDRREAKALILEIEPTARFFR